MRRARGFTLVEVLVALAIVTAGMAAVLTALSSSADTLGYLRDKTFAQWVALNEIASLRLAGQLPPLGKSDGTVEFGARKWRWRREVVATELPGVVRIDMRVRPADSRGGEDSGWLAFVQGVQGNAVGAPNGYLPDWGSQLLPGQGAPAAAGPAPTPVQSFAPGGVGASGLSLDTGSPGSDAATEAGSASPPVTPLSPDDTPPPEGQR